MSLSPSPAEPWRQMAVWLVFAHIVPAPLNCPALVISTRNHAKSRPVTPLASGRVDSRNNGVTWREHANFCAITLLTRNHANLCTRVQLIHDIYKFTIYKTIANARIISVYGYICYDSGKCQWLAGIFLLQCLSVHYIHIW